MEKISGIIPGNARVTSVDMTTSNTMRPGAPGFGAPRGQSAQENQVSRSTAAIRNPIELAPARWKRVEDEHSEIVKNLSDSFFMKNKSPVYRDKGPALVNVRPMNGQWIDSKPFKVNRISVDRDPTPMGEIEARGIMPNYGRIDQDMDVDMGDIKLAVSEFNDVEGSEDYGDEKKLVELETRLLMAADGLFDRIEEGDSSTENDVAGKDKLNVISKNPYKRAEEVLEPNTGLLDAMV